MNRTRVRGPIGAAILAAAATFVPAADTAPAPDDVKAVAAKGYEFLKGKQNADGSFGDKRVAPGFTALTAAALVKSGKGPDDPVVAKAMKYLEGKIQKDGGVYDQGLQNYTTCLAIMAFKEANTDGKYDKVIKAAADYARGLQYGEGLEEKDPKFGGAGYDGKTRPDLSNTHFFVEALIAAGAGKDDPAVKKALAFVSRSQNLPGEENKLPYAEKTTDDDKGGFVYSALEAGKEKNPKATPAGGLRSEGAMTYAGLKSFLYAGVGKGDPRVKAALDWIKRHYTLDENPGQGKAGLFYYYQTFAKTMSVLGEDEFEDAKGKKHAWKKELFEKLKSEQKADGSWANTSKQFMEDLPELATAFALLSLGYCK